MATYNVIDVFLEIYETMALNYLICFWFRKIIYELDINSLSNAEENRLQDHDTDRQPPINEGIDQTTNSDRQEPGQPTRHSETLETYQPPQTPPQQVYPPPQPTEIYQPLAPPIHYLPPPPPLHPLPPAQNNNLYFVLSQSQYTMQPFVPHQLFAFQSLFGTALDPSSPRQTAPLQTTLTGIGVHYASGNNCQMQSTTTVVAPLMKYLLYDKIEVRYNNALTFNQSIKLALKSRKTLLCIDLSYAYPYTIMG